jgi:HD-GYP domain-containing protein (c-di-GMP phosphodiesterase class II)
MKSIHAAQSARVTLRRLDPEKLEVGMLLPGAICTADGRVLIQRGRTLQHGDIERLSTHLTAGVYGGAGWPEHFLGRLAARDRSRPAGTEAAFRRPCDGLELIPFSVDDLKLGERLPHPIYNKNGVLLIGAGVEISGPFLARLRRQGIFEVHTPRSDKGPDNATPVTQHLDRVLDSKTPADLRRVSRRQRSPRLSLARLREEQQRARETFSHSIEEVAQITVDAFERKGVSLAGASEVINRFINMIRLDPSIVPAVTILRQAEDEYLFQHALNVALLSLTIGNELSLPPEQLLQIGVGALLQDVGMLRVPSELRLAPRCLTPEERAEVAQHPIYTLNHLEGLFEISQHSLMIAYQSHERGDCSGYPGGHHRSVIHPFARLVAVADTFAAITSHRPHRNARSPYEAMHLLLREGARDRFDRDVLRALLDCISLFPIGSYVRLSSGDVAKVLRANPGLHTKPVVVVLNRDGSESDFELDLSRGGGICVVQALRDEHDRASALANHGLVTF